MAGAVTTLAVPVAEQGAIQVDCLGRLVESVAQLCLAILEPIQKGASLIKPVTVWMRAVKAVLVSVAMDVEVKGQVVVAVGSAVRLAIIQVAEGGHLTRLVQF